MLSLILPVALAAPIPVELVKTDATWGLLRGGEPYAVRGVGGSHGLDLLVEVGGTSIRTWGVGDETAALLDEAHARGLSVALGIWLAHERHGFDYSDPAQVAAQLAEVEAAVAAYKDHPAVLVWGLGNEMEGFADGDDPQVWVAVCDAARRIQALDPHHPVMTTTAEVGGGRVAGVGGCPHIDIHGINTYGGASSVAERYRAAGGTKPVLLTEYGPRGTWEVQATDYGSFPEETSTDKARTYARIWRESIQGDAQVMGGYAFVWAWKTEATATWFGMFLPDGTRLGAVDALAQEWGRPVSDRVPEVSPLLVDGGDRVEPGDKVTVRWTTRDPEAGALQTGWVLRREITELTIGGDAQVLPPSHPEAIVRATTDAVELKMPKGEGAYRLYATVRDEAGGGATASVPILVGTPGPHTGALPMPWWVYQDEGVGGPWVPSGHMGNLDGFTLDLGWTRDCASPPSCIRVETTSDGWSGVAWQVPANNWGDLAGGVDLTEAKVLRFKVRGEFGWGRLTAGVGLVDDPDKAHPDSFKAERTVELGREWQEVRVRLKGDRSHVITGFWWVLPTQRPVTVYIDDVVFE